MKPDPTLRTILITMGDPLGIGPEVICKALSGLLAGRGMTQTLGSGATRHSVRSAAQSSSRNIRFVIIGSRDAFEKVPTFARIARSGRVDFHDIDGSDKNRRGVWRSRKSVIPARAAGHLSFVALKLAVGLMRAGYANALVTGPISKENMAAAGFDFPGHTEYLCHEFGVQDFAMMLFHERLRVTLATIHVPLRSVPQLLTRTGIAQKITLTAQALLRDFEVRRPRIAVCGLNPHAGENGLIGDEENRIIAPAVRAAARRLGHKARVTGPLPADTVFHKALAGEFDAVICQYHDQGLIPLKATGFFTGVNMTLGLPFVRTSPDHGTAFNIVGKDLADPRSMRAAIEAAVRSVRRQDV